MRVGKEVGTGEGCTVFLETICYGGLGSALRVFVQFFITTCSLLL
jgi:hypothetical protein